MHLARLSLQIQCAVYWHPSNWKKTLEAGRNRMQPAAWSELQPIPENSNPSNPCVGRITTIKATMSLGQSFAAISQANPSLQTASWHCFRLVDCVGESTLVGVLFCRRFNSPNSGPGDSIRPCSDDHSVI